MTSQDDKWDLEHLQDHLQAAAGLEAWTIPYYMAPMFSIVDRSSEAYQLIQSVVHQEMLHLQLVSNIANAYGRSPTFGPETFPYKGLAIPHLDFDLDPDNPKERFSPFSAEIGPLDERRVNGMCLVEYPEWDTGGKPDPAVRTDRAAEQPRRADDRRRGPPAGPPRQGPDRGPVRRVRRPDPVHG